MTREVSALEKESVEKQKMTTIHSNTGNQRLVARNFDNDILFESY
jgi:hypothetical protein